MTSDSPQVPEVEAHALYLQFLALSQAVAAVEQRLAEVPISPLATSPDSPPIMRAVLLCARDLPPGAPITLADLRQFYVALMSAIRHGLLQTVDGLASVFSQQAAAYWAAQQEREGLGEDPPAGGGAP